MFCTNCGRQLDHASPFCRYCGTPAATAGPVYPLAKKKNYTAVIVAVILAVVLIAVVAVWLISSRTGKDSVFAACEDVIIDMNDVTPNVQAEDSGDGFVVSDQDGQAQSAGSSNSGSADYSTSERPDMSHFLWYTEGVYYDGLPYDAVPITEFSDLTGSWKAYVLFDPDNIADAYGFQYLNTIVDGDVDNVSLTLDWYKMYLGDSFEEYDLSEVEDSVLYGDYSQGSVAAGEPGYMIYITDFYMLNAKQYALGYMELESGEAAYVAMVRP